MKIPSIFSKPRWQSKDAAQRRLGVAEDNDAELQRQLPTLARTDAEPSVRIAAMRRLADPALTQRLAHEDLDAGVRADARRLWFDLLAGTHARSPSPAECARLLRAQDDPALIEHIAKTATDAPLRGAALSRATRMAFVAERVVADPDGAIRLAALERIDDEATLDRLVERTRKTDKRVSRAARERIERLRIGRGDAGAIDARARTLCERMEQVARSHDVGERDAIEAAWSTIETQVADGLRTRYHAARALLDASRERAEQRHRAPTETVDVAPDPNGNDVAESPSDAVGSGDSREANASSGDAETAENPASSPPASAAIDEPPVAPASSDPVPMATNAEPAAPTDEARPKRSADKPRDPERQREAGIKLEEAAAAFEAAVEAGNVAKARDAHATIASLRKSADHATAKAVMRRLAEAENRYAELSRWQHWGDNQRRRQLCESIEALAGSGEHPDAIATRVREAQAEWTRLDAAEGHGKDAPAQGWARRFHAACRHALEPTRAYFRKRQEVRKSHGESIAGVLAAAREFPADSSDWATLAKHRQSVVEALRALDGVDPRERKSLARDLKSMLDAFDARLDAHHGDIERSKSSLIAEAEALAADTSRNVASSARTLQQRWRDLGNGRRNRDQAQWKVFRAALDAAFARLDAERGERATKDAEARSEATALVAALEALASDASPARASIARIDEAWNALRLRDEALQRRYRDAQDALRDAGSRRERATRRATFDAWLARYRLCRDAERTPADAQRLRAEWDLAPPTDIAASALATRFERALGDDTARASTSDGDRDTLLRLEMLAGIDAPAADQDRRRSLQIEKLSARMRGSSATSPRQELIDLLATWSTATPADESDEARFDRAAAAAIETLP